MIRDLNSAMKIFKFFGIAILLLGVAIYASSDYFIEKKLRTELSKIINSDSLGYYNYSIKKLDLSIITGSITIKGVKIEPTQIAIDSLKKSSNNVRVLVSFSCDIIKMKGFEIKHFLKTQELIINEFIIERPLLDYSFNKKKKSNSTTLALSNLLSDSFKKATLKKFIIDRAKITIKDIDKIKPLVQLENFTFKLTNAVVDSTTIHHFSPFNYDNIEFSANSLSINIHDDFDLTTGIMSFNALKNTTTLTNFTLKPNYSQKQFSSKYPVQKQWVAIELDTLKIMNVHFEKLIQHGVFEIDKITLTNANIGLYKDKSKPAPPFKKQLLPASALRLMKIKLAIDTIEVKRSRIVINEKSKRSGQVSYLSFEDLNAQMYGFSNDSTRLISNKYLRLYAQTKIMNAAQVNLEAKFDLLSKTDYHTAKATIGGCDMTVFNKVLEPMMLVVVKSGNLKSLNYQYTANDIEANGILDFEYDNVKLEILNKEEQTKKQGFLSLAANTVIKSENLKANPKNYTQGVIKATREQHKSIFPYFWHTVQSSIIYTMAPALSDIKREEKQANKKGWFKKK